MDYRNVDISPGAIMWSPYLFPAPIEYIEVKIVIYKPKCECGSEKVREPGHSQWCPKYEEL